MISFFRKLRLRFLGQNKVTQYLMYALGEILLVVIGILIALQVNTWNEERQQKAQVSTYARALIGDLQADIKSVKLIAFQAERAYVCLDSLVKRLVNYEAMTHHMDLDYEEDSSLGNEARAALGRVVNRNYDQPMRFLPVSTPFKEPPVRIRNFSETDQYRQLQNQGVDFINADEKMLQEAVNYYVQLKYEMNIRYSQELPALISEAEQIIALLEQEYR